MKFTADDFRQLYSAMPDEELLSVEPDELTPLARECYEAELLRRSIPRGSLERAVARPPAPRADYEETARVPLTPLADPLELREEEDLAAAAVFPSRDEAVLPREVLQAAGIPTFLENDLPTGFRLLTPVSYADQAREILAAPDEDEAV